VQAILVFSHGSVLCGAERNLVDLVGRLRARGDAPIVELGFLNYNQPSFADAVERCVRQGATRIVIAPYFLIAGKFVVADLPRVIAEERAKHPQVEFLTADVIGFHPALADAILASATTAKPTSEWRSAIRETAEWCRDNPKCPLHGTDVCRAHHRVPAHQEVPL
jgi:sirohydrochlorin ferrochelatase